MIGDAPGSDIPRPITSSARRSDGPTERVVAPLRYPVPPFYRPADELLMAGQETMQAPFEGGEASSHQVANLTDKGIYSRYSTGHQFLTDNNCLFFNVLWYWFRILIWKPP